MSPITAATSNCVPQIKPRSLLIVAAPALVETVVTLAAPLAAAGVRHRAGSGAHATYLRGEACPPPKRNILTCAVPAPSGTAMRVLSRACLHSVLHFDRVLHRSIFGMFQ